MDSFYIIIFCIFYYSVLLIVANKHVQNVHLLMRCHFATQLSSGLIMDMILQQHVVKHKLPAVHITEISQVYTCNIT